MIKIRLKIVSIEKNKLKKDIPITIGDKNEIKDSFNTINVFSDVETQIGLIKREFNEGNIRRAFIDIGDTKNEHSSNEKVRYKLLTLEAQFYLILGNYQRVSEDISYLEENFSKYLDEAFFEIKASLLSLDNDKENFDQVIKKLIKEFSGYQSPKEYFDLIFLLNSKKPEEAKLLYENYINSHSDINKKIKYIGGMIYANLYIITSDISYYSRAEVIYNDYLESENASYFEKLEIYKFFSIEQVNKLLNGKHEENFRTIVETTAQHIEKITNDLSYFEDESRIRLQNHYLHCLFFLNKIEFKQIFNKYLSKEIDSINFILRYFESGAKELDSAAIEERILEKNESEVLIRYLNYLVRLSPEKAVEFLTKNKRYLANEIVLNLYLEAKIITTKKIDDMTLQSLENRKNDSLISYLSYLEAKQFLNNQLEDSDIRELLKFFDKEEAQEILVVKAMRLLSVNKYQKDYLSLGLKYKNIHRNILNETLKICEKDPNILLSDFERFTNEIEIEPHSIAIANIYLAYGKISVAYGFYKTAWNYFPFNQQEKIDFACSVLQNCTLQNYFNNHGEVIDSEQDKMYKSYLESKINNLSIEQCSILSYYLIAIEKNNELGFCYINTKLLRLNIHDLHDQQKEMLSKIYFFTIIQKISENNDINSNLLLQQNNQMYISNVQYTDINNNYTFIPTEQTKFDLLSRQKEVKKSSIFHNICGQFIYTMKSDHFFSIESASNDPLSGIKEFMHEEARKDKDNLQAYSDGESIPFWQLSKNRYENYFNLVPTLLESPAINFNAGYNNPMPFEVKKILTFSSIVFLDHINMLDRVLARKDIFIQKTTVSWLLEFIRSLDNENEMLRIHSDGKELYKNLSDKESIQRTQEYLIALATKITELDNIIDDRDEILEIKDSYNMLAPHMGKQEYKALAFSYKYNYQIITEDRIFEMLFKQFKFNTSMLSNSISLLVNILNDPDELLEIYLSLHNKHYKYILHETTTRNILHQYVFEKPIYLMKEYPSKILKMIVQIAYNYGWMDEIDEYYDKHYAFKVPMLIAPKQDSISRNIEYIRELIEISYKEQSKVDSFNEEDLAEIAKYGFKEAQRLAREAGHSIYISEGDSIYEVLPTGKRHFIKKIAPKVSIKSNQKLETQ